MRCPSILRSIAFELNAPRNEVNFYHLETRFKKSPVQSTLISVTSETQIRSCIVFFYLGLTARQDYFTHFEQSQSIGCAKTGDPREKPPDHPQAELGLSHM